MHYQNQLSCGKFLPTFCPLRVASQHSHPCAFTSTGQPSLTLETGSSISIGCAVRIAAQRRCGVNLHASVLCAEQQTPWERLGFLSWPCFEGVAAGQGTRSRSWILGERRLLEPVIHPDEWEVLMHVWESSWRLWKKGGFLGILYLRLAFPRDCYRQAVLRCLSSRCLCEWLALRCGVKPLLGQALFSGRGSSLAFAVLVCGVLLSWSDPLLFSTNCSSSSGCTPPYLFVCLFWHENPELHLSWH